MNEYGKMTTQEDGLLELVRSADPLAGSVSVTPDEGEAVLRQVLLAPRQSGAPRRRRWLMGRRRLLLVACATAAVAAGGVGAAFASGLFGDSGGVQAARIFASSSGVADVHTLSASPSGHANVVEGTMAGESVIAATIGNATTPFIPMTKLLAGRDLAVHTGSGGSAGSVGWVAAAGVVSARVARVDVEGQGGAVQSVNLTSGTFAVELDPAFQPAAIVAYDNAGHEVGRTIFPGEQPPTP